VFDNGGSEVDFDDFTFDIGNVGLKRLIFEPCNCRYYNLITQKKEVIMPNSNYRVTIPKNAEELLDLAGNVLKKHTELAAGSPLNAMVSHSWTDNGSKVATCQDLHKQAEELTRQAEEAYRQRDLLLGDVKESVLASRDVLLGVYRETPKKLGEFGFEVDDTIRAAKKQA
jgi:hypothetical protein